MVSGISSNCKYLVVYLLLLTVLSKWCLSVHIFSSPGIEPGNLIRSTLIRSPPGAFFVIVENIANILCFDSDCGIERKLN